MSDRNADRPETKMKMKKCFKENRALVIAACTLLGVLAIAWISYGLFGHRLIHAAYENDSIEILNRMMAGKGSTPVENYYQEADRLMRIGTSRLLIFFGIVVILIETRLLAKTALFCSSLAALSLALFFLFDTFPSLIAPLHLRQIEYFAYKFDYIPDPVLVFRNRPKLTEGPGNFFGDKYSPLYRVQVTAKRWGSSSADEEGFHWNTTKPAADVAVIGDSFMEFALDSHDSFGERLARISGLTVANFAVGGYGPFQYLELLKRYGIKKHPKFALFSFFEGNDLGDIRQYLSWKAGGDYNYFSVISKPFLQRYLAAIKATANYIESSTSTALQLALHRSLDPTNYVHPDIAVLRLGNEYHKVLLYYKNNRRSTDDIIASQEWKELKNILVDFKATSRTNDIIPIVLYIPLAAHIYADYSTRNSGENWLRIRNEQIAAKANVETAMIRLTSQLNIPFIDLCPVFEASARDGKLLYYPFDTHWNSEGREVAAAFVAKTLRGRLEVYHEIKPLPRTLPEKEKSPRAARQS